MSDAPIAGRYTTGEVLGRGASATVYSAHDDVLDRPVALKIISAALASDPDFQLRFQREARLAARLDHPNIVTVHDVGITPDGRTFIAMRLLSGRSLDQVISGRAPLPAAEAISYLRQLASALDYIHERGLVHRDIKPNNVVVDEHGRATLTDFGIARALDSARVTLPGLTIGTPRYMSPEQVRGEDPTTATDIYSLAVMAYEMFSGKPPFEGQGTGLMFKIVHEEPSPLAAHNPNLPPGLSDVLNRGLDKVATARWPSAGEFADAVAAIFTQAPMIATPTPAELDATIIQPAEAPVAAPVLAAAVVPAASPPVEDVPEPTEVLQSVQTPALVETPTLVVQALQGTGVSPEAPNEAAPSPQATNPPAVPPDLAATRIAQNPAPAAPPASSAPEARATARAVEPPAAPPPTPIAAAPPPAQPPAARQVPSPQQPSPPSEGPPPGGPVNRPEPVPAPAPVTSGSGGGSKKSGPPLALLGGGAAALLGAGVLAFVLMGGGDDDDPLATASETPTTEDAAATTPSPSATPSRTPTQRPTATSTSTATATATSPPTATPTPEGRWTEITSITSSGGNYVVQYTTSYPTPPDGYHVHFFWDTVPVSAAGSPGPGPWYVYYGPIPFQVAANQRPAGATQLCILVANPNHSINPGTGNCVALP